ncbi:Protein of unknown function (DUF1769) [Teratosphaeria destructans]|uniref:Domain of unknown function at the cortex 1 domain-containing protein n=1 Tax=Teratosphaeria destructans TaxID=418781 RepID=A0A9W7W5A2_9PEZI|nr:Protein of unknown function (DUF1769) [Teratosphaeria destructans]
MAAAVKAKLHHLTASPTSPTSPTAGPDDGYRLLVTAGPTYDRARHHTVPVNTATAIAVENAHLRAKITVRIRAYRGFPSTSPLHAAYFDDPRHDKDQYSIAFSFVPKHDLPSLDAVWGNDFDHPIRDKLPPGFNTAFRIVKEWIDPALNCDAYADEPWLYGPALSSWFALWIGELVEDGRDFPAPEDGVAMREGAEGSGAGIRERLGIPENGEKRRKFFQSAANREAFTFEKGRLYMADFYNPYIDFSKRSLKLPGFSMRVTKYLERKSHLLRYVFKDRETGEVYINVNFNLLWGKELEQAEQEEEARLRGEDGVVVGGGVAGNPAVNGHEKAGGADGAVEEEAKQSHPSSPQQPHPTEHKAESSPPAAAPAHPPSPDAAPTAVATQQPQTRGQSIMDMLKSTATADARYSGKRTVVRVEDELD